jgi:hypothetical protein
MKLMYAATILAVLSSPAAADSVYSFCSATAQLPNGSSTGANCTAGGYSPIAPNASITGSGNKLDISLINYMYGGASANVQGATLLASAQQTVSAAAHFVVSGGTGAGYLKMQGFSDTGNWSFPVSGSAAEFGSSFLAAPSHYQFYGSQYGNAISIPFVFGVPFELSMTSNLLAWAGPGFSGSFAGWELLHQWDLHLEGIVDASGSVVTDASLASVPEPASIILLVTVLAGVWLISRRTLVRSR